MRVSAAAWAARGRACSHARAVQPGGQAARLSGRPRTARPLLSTTTPAAAAVSLYISQSHLGLTLALMTPRARTATHAGSWYEADAPRLGQQLEGWLARVDASQIPPPGRSAADMSSPASSNSSAAAPLHLPADGAKAVIAP
jgi:hypothetical protein